MVAPLGPFLSILTGAELVVLDSGNSGPNSESYTDTQAIANLAAVIANNLPLAGGTMTGEITFAAGTSPAISIKPSSYHLGGDIQLNDFGVIKIGTAANTSGASFICSVVQEVTSNFHSFEDTSTWAPTTAGLGAASYNAGILANSTAQPINHINGFQYTGQVSGTNTVSIVRGFNSTPNVDTCTVTSVNGCEIADPAITNGGVVTGMYAFVYNGTGTASFNWGMYQSQPSTSHGPWNYMNGALGLGVQVPNNANTGVVIALTRTIGWGVGNGTAQVTTISQANGIITFNGPIQVKTYTIAQLLALTNLVAGELAYVVDTVGSGAATWHGAIAAGGSTAVEGYAFYNNGATAWQWL